MLVKDWMRKFIIKSIIIIWFFQNSMFLKIILIIYDLYDGNKNDLFLNKDIDKYNLYQKTQNLEK